MRFWLLDRICSYEPNTELTATKNVSLTEEYLADHFPAFPVLPGVFMLEAATQAGAWLVRLSEDFAHSVIVLQEAKGVKFADFVTPGNTLRMCMKQTKREGNLVHMRFRGEVDGRSCVNGKLVLECSNLVEDETVADRSAENALIDQLMVDAFRTQAGILTRGIQTRDIETIEAGQVNVTK
ncbi:MAG: 3-hydroxyacyl-ACP dehydratase FabZ family protein [Pirellulales bacterium]